MLQRHGPYRRRVLFAAVVVPLLLPAIAAAQKVMVDGDLTDIAALAPATASDPAWDISPAMPSGFDFTRVLVHYYPKQDTLYVGLDLMDEPAGPGAAGDVDGDGNPSARSHPAVFTDQFGIGQNERAPVAHIF